MPAEPGFDPVGGSLRVARSTLADLCALREGAVVPPETKSALARAGFLVGNELHPRLVPVAAAAARPLVRLGLDLREPNGTVHCEGWIDERFALLLSARGFEPVVFEATFFARSLLAGQLARVVGLGPRRRPKVTDAVEIDHGLLEAILGPGDLSVSQLEMLTDPLDELLPSWIEVLSLMSGGLTARWRAGVWWNSVEERPEARSFEILDSGAGLFFVSQVARGSRRYRRVRLRPVTSSQVWRLLTALVPGPDQVDEPLSS